MQLRDIMTDNISTVDKEKSVTEAAQIMRDNDIGSIPVCENRTPVGILTDRDIVVRGISEELDPDTVRTEELMSENLVYGRPDMDVHEALRIMSENQIRRLPIVENEEIVGVVSLGDIATKSNYMDEASRALADISVPSRPQG